MLILLAEDDPHIAQIVKLTLENMGGHQVDWVQDGKQALEKSADPLYELIILDDRMPEIFGRQVCKMLREKCDSRPIVILSAKSSEKELCDATAYIEKPFEPKELCRKIQLIATCTGKTEAA